MKKRIEGATFNQENNLQNLTGIRLYDCSFTDGEDALKGSCDIRLENCDFSSRNSLWNVQNFTINDSRLGAAADAPIRYAEHGKIIDSDIRGSQALRECSSIVIHDCNIFSQEFGWKCSDIAMEDSNVHAAYLLHESRNVRLDNVEVRGDFSFQYMDNVQVSNCFVNSNEAFRHSKNVTVVDSVIRGGCLGWHCENITFIGCKIIGAHPLCHCKNLKLIDCVMEGSEQAFEGSDVKATIVGHLNSIKNPLSGKIVADSIGEIIVEDADISECKIFTRG